MSGRPVKVAVIAGGGVYGMIPCRFLSAVGSESARAVDFLGGTSAGGIIALHLCAYGDTERLRRDFRENVRSMFTRRLSNWISPFAPKYCAEGIESGLRKALPMTASECPGRFVVPSFSFKTMRPVIFHNLDQTYGHLELWKMARATSAAPMYFPPYSEDILLDGGILENLPIVTTASMISRHCGIRPCDMDVLAIGTGFCDRDLGRSRKEVCRYSKLDWARELMPVLTTEGNELMSGLWGRNLGFRSFRLFNPVPIDGAMDNVDGIAEIEAKCELHLGEFVRVWNEFMES